MPLLKRRYEPFVAGQKNQKAESLSKEELISTTTLEAQDDPMARVIYAPNPTDKTGILADQLQGRPAQVYAASHPNLKAAPRSADAQRLEDAVTNYRRLHLDHP
jgi:hypothetical protein